MCPLTVPRPRIKTLRDLRVPDAVRDETQNFELARRQRTIERRRRRRWRAKMAQHDVRDLRIEVGAALRNNADRRQ